MAPDPIHVPITVKNIDIKNTVHKILIITCALKLSSFSTIFPVIHSAGLYVAKTSAITHIHIKGITLIAFFQIPKLKVPTSKHVISGAIIFTYIIDITAINNANSFLLRGNFM